MTRSFAARLEELESLTQAKVKGPPDLLAHTFPEQRALITDPAKLKAACTTRRAAKSYSGGLYAYQEAFRHPRSSVLIVGFTRGDLKRTWWSPVAKEIAYRYDLGCVFNEIDLSAKLPNGSMVYLLGLDQNETQRRNALGGKYPLVIVDEAQDYRTDLRKLVYDVLKPAVTDYRGTIVLLGTPSSMTSGLFFDVANHHEPGWSVHTWTTHQNTAIPFGQRRRMCDVWKEEIEEAIRTRPGVENTPGFRRNFEGLWVIDDSELVYRYKPGRNDIGPEDRDRRSRLEPSGWHRVLGIDLGYTDDSAFVLLAYHDDDPTLYVDYACKEPGLDFTAVASKAHWFQSRWDIDHIIVDGANKQGVEEMRRRHGLALIPADKRGKEDFIRLMDDDFITGHIKVDTDLCKPLITELEDLIWRTKRVDGRVVLREEDPALDNHLTDSCLYAWRFCYQYLSESPQARPALGSLEWQREEEDRLEADQEEQVREEIELRREGGRWI